MTVHRSTNDRLVPDLLYHTCLTVVEPGDKTTGLAPRVYVLSTHATIEAAKKAAAEGLTRLGFDRSDFEVYEEQLHATENWEHGGGVVVYAKTPAGQDFLVGTDTKANDEQLAATADGSLLLPRGIDHLHYVLQTTIDYRGSPAVFTEMQGAFTRRSDALVAAERCLLSGDVSKADFARYDERETLALPENWPFGEDVFIHAVSNTGENFLVTMTIPPKAASELHRVKHGSAEAKSQC